VSDKIKIALIVTKNGVFVSRERTDSYNRYNAMSAYKINGKMPKPSFHENWSRIDAVPSKIQKKGSDTFVNHRYETTDPAMVSDKIPASFARDEVAVKEDYEWIWKDEYRHLQSLYSLLHDVVKGKWETIDFEIDQRIDIDELKEINGFSYPVQRTQWRSDGTVQITEQEANHQLMDRLLFPQPVLPTLPCRLTSEQSYKIIREHVSRNIDPEWAKITSDYNFCFTVKKVIKLMQVEAYAIDLNAFKKTKRRKMHTTYRADREIIAFEMTNSKDNYKGYTPIKGFTGTDHEDLKKNIDKFLADLMEEINKPLVDCPKCKGRGVVEPKAKGE